MENSNYTMDDIAKFIADYNESNKYSSREWVINIPVVGRKLYEKAALENMKRTVFEKEYNKAKNGSVEEQKKGYAYECCLAVLQLGKEEYEFEKVQALVKEGNEASISLCKKLGFEYLQQVEKNEGGTGRLYSKKIK